ncbi:MAG: electron transfer flavoprotein subunit alpha/FixB family protein [Planctomycetota bacterium]|jgi:electron transfer flavoprotein alpha subunit|nr:electron transfer flavoprotein subunit alpha/FixB family protein [Planctomycetota bacterium]
MSDGQASAPGGVWIFGEQEGGVLHGATPELIGKGRELADQLGAPLAAVVFGADLDAIGRELSLYPVDAVLLADHPALGHYLAEPYAALLADLAKKRRPDIILAGATAIGRAFIPRAAALLKTGLTADCVGLEITPERLLRQTCPSFGGNIMAAIVCPERRPQMATIRPKVLKPAAKDGGRGGRVEKLAPAPELLRSRTERLEWLPDASDTAGLADADIIVAGGRGLGGPAGFALLERLARRLGGAAAASRPAVDEGWAPYSRQIGQTGRTVQPKLYLAFGISGAVHHLTGMSSSDRIIAVNKDPHAPIFSVADWGVAADALEVIPAMLRELGE